MNQRTEYYCDKCGCSLRVEDSSLQNAVWHDNRVYCLNCAPNWSLNRQKVYPFVGVVLIVLLVVFFSMRSSHINTSEELKLDGLQAEITHLKKLLYLESKDPDQNPTSILDSLSKDLAELKKQKAPTLKTDPALAKKIKALETQMAVLAASIAKLDAHVAQLAKTKTPLPQEEPPKKQPLPDPPKKVAPQVKPAKVEAKLPTLIAQALAHEDPAIRKEGLLKLAKLDPDLAKPSLLAALTDKHSAVRKTALQVAGTLGDASWTTDLLAAAAAEKEELTRLAYARVLNPWTQSKVIPTTEAAWQKALQTWRAAQP